MSESSDETPPDASRYVATSELPVPIEKAFSYHERPGCLGRLTPPWESVAVESSDQSIAIGSRVVLKTSLFGIPLRWRARHVAYDPPHLFADVQDSGPFALWQHRHKFAAVGPHRSMLTDEITYRVPAGGLGNFFGGSFVRGKIDAMFAYRHRITSDDLQLMHRYPCEPKTIAVSGASGLVGRSLCQLLTLLGHKVLPIVRDPTAGDDAIAIWGDDSETRKLSSIDVVIHLAGNSIAGKRWDESFKRLIHDSRVPKTLDLCKKIASLSKRPATLICASATGYYGGRGDEVLEESSAPGDDFLANVSHQWESACDPAREAGVRVVHARFGIILSPQGGALQKMLTPAKLLGGKLGRGDQWWSWIAVDDVLGGIVHAIETPSLSGPVNFVSPEPIRNAEFAQTLGQVLGRPAIFPAPAPMLRLALGEMADALLLAHCRVVPKRLLESGYEFRFSSLHEALSFYLGKQSLESTAG